MRLSWIFRCFLDAHGTDVIDAWYRDQTEPVQIKFDVRMKFLGQTPREGWIRPQFDTYRDGVGYIRFDVANLEYRIFGCPLRKMEYGWLIPATKKGKKFNPLHADTTAIERKDVAQSDRSQTRACYDQPRIFRQDKASLLSRGLH
jgi:hypothetical protein